MGLEFAGDPPFIFTDGSTHTPHLIVTNNRGEQVVVRIKFLQGWFGQAPAVPTYITPTIEAGQTIDIPIGYGITFYSSLSPYTYACEIWTYGFGSLIFSKRFEDVLVV